MKPERPDAIDRNDAEGAAAAAEYFIELYPYVMATGDTAELEAMSHETCESCTTTIEQASRIASNGDTYSGGSVVVGATEVYQVDELTGIFPVDVHVDSHAASIVDAAGSEVFSEPAQSIDRRIEVGRVDGRWVIVGVAEVPGP